MAVSIAIALDTIQFKLHRLRTKQGQQPPNRTDEFEFSVAPTHGSGKGQAADQGRQFPG